MIKPWTVTVASYLRSDIDTKFKSKYMKTWSNAEKYIPVFWKKKWDNREKRVILWRRHQMETFSALPATDGFTDKGQSRRALSPKPNG